MPWIMGYAYGVRVGYGISGGDRDVGLRQLYAAICHCGCMIMIVMVVGAFVSRYEVIIMLLLFYGL